MRSLPRLLAVASAAWLIAAATAQQDKVRVFVLAGQSNMEGKAKNELFERQAVDEETAPFFAHLRRDGRWVVRDDVFIKYGDRSGPLTLGYGSPGRTGMELEFGTVLGDRFEEPVLLVKAAWGGHSLYRQFRPPSAGLPGDEALARELARARDRVARRNEKNGRNDPLPEMADIRAAYGASYRKLLAEVRGVMRDPGALFPALRGKQPELAGCVWFQGWNDQYDGAEKEYAANLAHLVRDLRSDLQAPALPFVIAVMGQNGSAPARGAMRVIQQAQLALPQMAEFRGTVRAVRTDLLVDKAAEALYPTWKEHRDQWERRGSDHPYHYLGSAIWFTRIGRACADAMLELL